MSFAQDNPFEVVSMHSALFLSEIEEIECPYFPERKSRIEFDFPLHPDESIYGKLLEEGFRRAGPAFYRNMCEGCRDCIPIRLEPEKFIPSKSQRRTLRKNGDIRMDITPSGITDEKIELFSRYVTAFHLKPGEDRDLAVELSSIHEGYRNTAEMDYYLDDRLIAVGILDICTDAVSSDYFYHEPDLRPRGLGTFSALKEIELCLKMKKRYYFLGYYIPGCRKMSYKTNYRPCQLLTEGRWSEFK